MGISLQDIIGLFNISVGIMVVAAFLCFGTGFIVWIVRIGTIHREDGISIMSWGVAILFVLVVMLALVQFFQSHPAVASMVVALLIIAFIVWIILMIAAENASKKEDEH